MVCQKKHWKGGGHRAECAALSGAIAVPVIRESTEGKRDEADSGPSVGVASGDGRSKNKGGKKGKKGRR